MKSTILVFGLALLLAGISVSGFAELILYLPFEEDGGNSTTDKSGNGFIGTLNGGAEWVDGKHGSAIGLDGKSGMVTFDDHPELRLAEGHNAGSVGVRPKSVPNPVRSRCTLPGH